ncbi:MAG: dATP/dGTP diphosphohydrolase domain-containing protein [Bacteroidota bacterium]
MLIDTGRVAKLAHRLTAQEVSDEKAMKPRPDLIPGEALLAIGKTLGYGFDKHGVQTWKEPENPQADPAVHLASAMRHIVEYQIDPNATEEGSGMPVLWHAAAQLCILIDCIERKKKQETE